MEQKENQKAKLLFLILFFLLVFSPFFFKMLGASNTELGGVTVATEKPTITTSNILDGNYQNQLESWYGENFPERNRYIQAYSQIKFILFKTTGSSDVFVGKDDYLYEAGNYVEDGLDAAPRTPEEDILSYVINLRSIQDSCDELGKSFLYVIPSNKATFTKEYLPTRYVLSASTAENYSYYKHLKTALDEYGVRYFDTVEFLEKLETENYQYPFFTKSGIHWNYVAGAEICKEIIKTQEGFTELPQIGFTVEKVDNAQKTDNDIYALANLTFPIEDFWVYPNLEKVNPEGRKALMVGTSFNEQLAQIFVESGTFEQVIDIHYTSQQFCFTSESINYTAFATIEDIGISDIFEESDYIIFSSLPQSFNQAVSQAASYSADIFQAKASQKETAIPAEEQE